ncbi:MAG: family 43 glycosylhydrolase [Sedimentisphaerales bacterium]|nr:family 43 glycosylhydrolase [Sedimentisphaerales bacterium]
MSIRKKIFIMVIASVLAAPALAQPVPWGPQDPNRIQQLSEIYMRDVCILPDPANQTYYMIGPGFNSVRMYTSKDLKTWQGPKTIFTTPADIWGDIPVVGIWAPEMHSYKGKYYLFLTFDTRNLFAEQWRNWRPRVTRGSQILVGDSPNGPFKPFQNHSTLPTDMMTLDGTLWVEDGKPYIVFCHEWVQISNGTIEYMALRDDLSETIGEPTLLFRGSDGPWATFSATEGNFVTDGPYLYKSKSGRLFMIWSSFITGSYTVGLAISDSGKLAGPWKQQKEPIYDKNGGHAMLFTTFDGKLMMVLHAPNNREAQPRIFELQDTGENLKVVKEFTGKSG